MLSRVEHTQHLTLPDAFAPPELRRRLSWRTQRRREYEKRKVAGLCAYASCPVAVRLHRYCGKHLQAMAERQRRVFKQRKKDGLCTYCGTQPPFWGVRCILCRQKFCKDLLPAGARRALRIYREAERQFELELTQARARFEIRQLLARGNITGDYARALRLYAGTNASRGSRWRTYREVGLLMHLSTERVRQLLKPSKIILADKLADKIPWKPVRRSNRGDNFPRRPYRRKHKCAPVRNDSALDLIGKNSAGK